MTMIPQKLKAGDEIRIIAPSTSMSILYPDQIEIAKQRFNELGLKVTLGKHVMETSELLSASIKSRVEDLHEAFLDPNVKGIFTVIGGHNINDLLEYIDYELIQQNPKILCGYSDITALSNSIYAKTGLVNYSGPHFSTFGMEKGIEYTTNYLKKCLMEAEPFEIHPSETWSDDEWYMDQNNRTFIPNDGPLVIQEGVAEGTIIGGNLCTLNLLQGTEFMPIVENTLLFLEDDYLVCPRTFKRDLQSLIHAYGIENINGIIIGRFQKASELTEDLIRKIIGDNPKLSHLPIAANLNFGHTTPHFTFPIGGKASVRLSNDRISVRIESF